MSYSEKLTVNLNVVDIGQIDVLVEQGFYSNRTDFIKSSVRNQLAKHEEVIANKAKRDQSVIGALIYNRQDLEKYKANNEKLVLKAIGLIVFSKDIDETLIRETIESISIKGILKMDKQLESKISDLIQR